MSSILKPLSYIKGRAKIAFIIVLIILAWLFSGYFYKKDNTVVHPTSSPINISAKKIFPSYLELEVTLPATLNKDNIFALRSKSHGRVKKIIPKEGTLVKQNDVIFELEDETLEAEIAQAYAALEHQTLEYQANKSLAENGFTSKLKVASSAANLKAAEAKLLTLETKKKDLQIKAPFDGVVDKIEVQVGEIINGSSSTLANIFNIKKYYFSAYLSGHDIKKINTSTPIKAVAVTGKSSPIPPEKFKGKITFLSKVANSITKTYLINLELEHANTQLSKEALYPPLNVKVTLPLGRTQVLIIPSSSLIINEAGLVGFKYLIPITGEVKFMETNVVKDLGENFAVEPHDPIKSTEIILITKGGYLTKEGFPNIKVTEEN